MKVVKESSEEEQRYVSYVGTRLELVARNSAASNDDGSGGGGGGGATTNTGR